MSHVRAQGGRWLLATLGLACGCSLPTPMPAPVMAELPTQEAPLESRYDASRGTTFHSFETELSQLGGDGGVTLSAYYSVPGHGARRRPDRVSLSVTRFNTDEPLWTDRTRFHFELDGAVLRPGKVELLQTGRKLGMEESLNAEVGIRDFERLHRARRLLLYVGETAFPMDASVRKDLHKLISPPTP